jgi:hypothetical protein
MQAGKETANAITGAEVGVCRVTLAPDHLANID